VKNVARNELETRAELVDPRLRDAGWTDEKVRRDKYITEGKILFDPTGKIRTKRKKPDYILYYPNKESGIPIAVIEAEPESSGGLAGMQQAKEYKSMLGVPFAYSTDGKEIEEYDDFTKKTTSLEAFPPPEELWRKYVRGKNRDGIKVEDPLLYPYYPLPEKPIRYYQDVAVRRVIEAIIKGKRRVLLTMATGSGKTYVAFQVAWKLHKTGKITRILYLVDRIFLRGQARDTFFPFGDAREELVETREITLTKDIYFATYQTLYSERDGKRIYELFDPDFFDMVIIDECHRSGWNRWHDILKHFSGAIHFGMTATPKRDDNIDTYDYFGEPVYSYPMKQGIEDGFLAPYEIRRIFTNLDKSGKLQISEAISHGAKIEVPKGTQLKEEYSAKEFEKSITLPDRTKTIAEYLARLFETFEPKEKSAIFCVSQTHAREIARELNNRFNPLFGVDNYAVAVIADERDSNENLDKIRSSEEDFPVVATTVDLLSTGVDIPPVKNIVFLQYIDSKVVFHQIIGRGCRIDPGSRKYTFRIIDFTNATRLLDSDWDYFEEEETYRKPFDRYLACKLIDADTGFGIPRASVVVQKSPNQPIRVQTESSGCFTLSELPSGRVRVDCVAKGYKRKETKVPTFPSPNQWVTIALEREIGREKTPLVKAKNVEVYISEEGKLKIDAARRRLTDAEYIEYCRDGAVKKVASLSGLKKVWKNRSLRRRLMSELEEMGINLDVLAATVGRSDSDRFDLLAHIVFGAPLLSKEERARRIKFAAELYEDLAPKAREILMELSDKASKHGVDEILQPTVWRTPPFDRMGFLRGVAKAFGGIAKLKEAISKLESLYYSDLGVV
jgi:type I restriction enzyme R subunit